MSQLQPLAILLSKQSELYSTVDSLAQHLKSIASSIGRDRKAQKECLNQLQQSQDRLLSKFKTRHTVSFNSPSQSNQELKTIMLEVEQRLLQRIDTKLSPMQVSEASQQKILDELKSIREVSCVQPRMLSDSQEILPSQYNHNHLIQFMKSIDAKIDALGGTAPGLNWKAIRLSLVHFGQTYPISFAFLFVILMCLVVLIFRIATFSRS
eukprot:TRINITY_DN2433_c0_g1_i1.p1 TRINITY_DN2433_c0_g1~~TRINITY_DN2433_c0_g1_i1.p1  ORF type:complete len:209 (+),score=1.64 TRINITY_DN2433_c0_g1_i1:342-968(+)